MTSIEDYSAEPYSDQKMTDRFGPIGFAARRDLGKVALRPCRFSTAEVCRLLVIRSVAASSVDDSEVLMVE